MQSVFNNATVPQVGEWLCVCWVYISMCSGGSGGGKGEGGQVFTLTRFNEGCVHVCVCVCVRGRASVCFLRAQCFHGEHTS